MIYVYVDLVKVRNGVISSIYIHVNFASIKKQTACAKGIAKGEHGG